MLDLCIKAPDRRYDLLPTNTDMSRVLISAAELEEYSAITDTVILWLAAEKGMPVSVMFNELKDTVWLNPDYTYKIEKNHQTGDISLEWRPKTKLPASQFGDC